MPLRDQLLGLPFVVSKRLHAKDGFFTAGRMFALLSDDTVLLRLPTAGDDEEQPPAGQSVVGPDPAAGLWWVSIPLPARDPDELAQLVVAAHHAVRRASRRRPRPGLRRRRTRTPT
jgi:hypothetical protein